MNAQTKDSVSAQKPTSMVFADDIHQRPLRLRLYPDDALRGVAKGCLSLPGVQLDLRRLLRIELHGADPSGKPLHMKLKSLMARVVQHEVDLLDGILICDYPPSVPDMLREMKGLK